MTEGPARPNDLRALLGDAADADSLGVVAEVLRDVPFGLAVYDASDEEFRIVYANEAAGPFMEVPIQDAIGAPLVAAFPSASLNGTIELFKKVRSTGEAVHFREIALGSVSDGAPRSWNYDIHPITDAAGRVTHVLGVGHEVTELVQARERVREAANLGLSLLLEISRHAEAAGSLDEFFGRVCETVAHLLHAETVGFALYHPASQTLDLQPHGYGLSPELAAMATRIPCRRAEHDLAAEVVFGDLVFRGDVAAMLANPAVQPYRELLQAVAARNVLAISWRGGDERLGVVAALDSAAPGGFTDEDLLVLRTAGRATGLVYQRWRAEQQLAARAEELAALERSKSGFLSLASHELRGPLTVVGGYVSMLKDGSVLADTPGVLDIMESKLREIETMVTLMLEAARLEESRFELKREAADLREVVAGAVGSTRPLSRPGQAILVEAPATPVAVVVDVARISTVVTNLLTNAIKYSPAPTTITCTVGVEGERALVRVRDQGPGIAAEDLPKLFRRFGRLQTADSTHVPGTGLGLYIARETARLHGGDVTVTSTVGSGSEFVLQLPLETHQA